MKVETLTRWYAVILLIIFGGVVLHAPFSVGFGELFPDVELVIKSWKEILMIPAGLIALYLVAKTKRWREFTEDRLIQVVALYALIHVALMLLISNDQLAELAGIAIGLRYVAYFSLVYILLKLDPSWKNKFIKVAMAGALVVIGFGVAQLFLPIDVLVHIGYGPDTIQPYLTVDQNYDYIRINSTMRGPNPLGAYVVMVLGILAAVTLRRKLYSSGLKMMIAVFGAFLSSFVVLWVSYSRSALAAAGFTVFLVAFVAGRHLISKRIWIAGSIATIALLGGLILARDHPFVTNVVLHEDREGGSSISSNDGHIESLIDGTERMINQPFGAGIGSTGSASLLTDKPLIIENQYLFTAHEVGWAGLMVFMFLFGVILSRLWNNRQDWLSLGVFASGVGLALIGILLPVWADDTVSIVWWGLAAVAITSGGKDVRKKSQQKTA